MPNAKNEARIKFVAETEEFTSAIKSANSEIKTLGSELKLADATFKNTGNATEYLKSKASILKQELQANAEKQRALTEKLEVAKRIYGEGSEEVARLQRELIGAQTQEQKLATELKNTNDELEDQAKKADPAAQAIEKANAEIETLDSQLKLAEATFKNTGDATEYLKSKASILKQELQANTEKQKALTEELEAAKRTYGEDSEEVERLQRELTEAQTQEQRLAAELKNTNKELEDQAKKADPAAQAIEKIGKAGEQLQKTGKVVADVGKKLAPVSATVTGIGVLGVKSFAEVDKTMQLTNKTMGNTEKEAKLLNQAMKDAASNSTFGMKDAAEATLNFARAGLDAEQSAAALAPAMNLAAGEGGKLDTVSAGLVGTINGFRDSFDNTSHYADVFAAACNNSALDIDGLSNSMGVAAPIFRTAGKEVEDAALYMGVMANANIDANTSANALKTGLMRLADPAKGARDAMEKYGISASAVWGKDGSMKDSVEIQKNLHDSFQKLSEKEQLAAASAIFGKNQGAAWLALINTAPDEVEALSNSLENCSGTTSEMADAMMSGFGGSLEKLKSSIDVAVTSIGEALAPTIQQVGDVIRGVVDKFNSLDDSQKQTIATIGLIVAAVGPVLVVIGSVLQAVGTVMTSISAVKGALTALNAVIAANPMVFIIVAIMAVVAALNYLYNHCETFRNFVDGVMAAIVGFVTTAWTTIQTKTKDILTKVRTTATSIVTGIRTKITQTWTAIRTTTTSVWNAVKSGVSNAINGAKNTVNTVTNAVKTKVTQTWNAIKSTTTSVWNGIKSGISNAINGAKDTASRTAEAIKTGISNTWENIKNKTTQTWDGIKTAVSSKVEAAKADVKSKFDAMKSGVESTIDALKTKVSDTFDSIKNTMKEKIESAKDAVKKAVDKIKSHFPVNLGKIFKLKIPKIHVSGGKAPFGIGGAGTPPHFSVTWNRLGAIFRKPVVFGSPEYGLQGFGEAGAEVAAPLETLKTMIAETVRSNVPMIDYDRLATAVAKANAKLESRMVIDHREVGRIVREMAK